MMQWDSRRETEQPTETDWRLVLVAGLVGFGYLVLALLDLCERGIYG